jgi:hypothetical protein
MERAWKTIFVTSSRMTRIKRNIFLPQSMLANQLVENQEIKKMKGALFQADLTVVSSEQS